MTEGLGFFAALRMTIVGVGAYCRRSREGGVHTPPPWVPVYAGMTEGAVLGMTEGVGFFAALRMTEVALLRIVDVN